MWVNPELNASDAFVAAWLFLGLQAIGNWSGEWVIGGVESKVTFQPAAMLTYAVNARNELGFEYYSDLGPLKNFG